MIADEETSMNPFLNTSCRNKIIGRNKVFVFGISLLLTLVLSGLFALSVYAVELRTSLLPEGDEVVFEENIDLIVDQDITLTRLEAYHYDDTSSLHYYRTITITGTKTLTINPSVQPAILCGDLTIGDGVKLVVNGEIACKKYLTVNKAFVTVNDMFRVNGSIDLNGSQIVQPMNHGRYNGYVTDLDIEGSDNRAKIVRIVPDNSIFSYVFVNITEPKVGQKAELAGSVTNDNIALSRLLYNDHGITWKEGGKTYGVNEELIFQAGHTYTCVVALSNKKEVYGAVTKDTTVKINGKNAPFLAPYQGIPSFSCDFYVDPFVESVQATVTQPKAGDTENRKASVSDNNILLSRVMYGDMGITWAEGNQVYNGLAESDKLVFQAGHTYTCILNISAKTGDVTSSTKVTVNGKPASFMKQTGSIATFSCDFEVPAKLDTSSDGGSGTSGSNSQPGSSSSMSGGITPSSTSPLPALEDAILSWPGDDDVKGSTFSLLQAKGVPTSKTSVKLTWKRIPGATGYIIYGNKCGKKNRYEKIKTVTGKTFTQKKLKKGTYYKYVIVAVKGETAITISKTIHVATKGGKVGNHTKVILNQKKLSLKKGKIKTVKATLKAGSLKVKIHRKVAFESSNEAVATVSKNGKIKARGKGNCYVYAYAQNGLCAKVKVVVK